MTLDRARAGGDVRLEAKEDGFTLPMLLVCVALIAVMFVTVLGFQSTALRAQTVLDNKRIDDLAADAALDDAVAQLQINRAAGVSGGAGGCNNSTQATLVTWHDPSAGDIDVQCRIDTTSSVAGYARAVHLEAASGSASITTADVTFYDQPSPSTHTVISITCWNRRQPPCA